VSRAACNKEIADPGQPLLLNHPKKKDITRQRNKNQLELCFLTGLTGGDSGNTHPCHFDPRETPMEVGQKFGLMYVGTDVWG